MDTFLQMQVFFFISSVGFIVLGILVAVFLFYLIRATDTLSRILEQIEKDVNNIGDTTKEALNDMRDSTIFRFIFGKKKKSRKN